ncbi:FCD domain-containing protein [Cupriavidus sp. H39]|uniref:FCD domain-containing protein n=1 Tax=Cupriavidus sp. H39 TaxID=3401635 RepID=UPI003D05C449
MRPNSARCAATSPWVLGFSVENNTQHRAIIDAIRHGYPAETAAAMRMHLLGVPHAYPTGPVSLI